MLRPALIICWLALGGLVGVALAQQPFRVAGFSYSTLAGGTHFYSCERAICGVGVAISLERQDGTQSISVNEYGEYAKHAHANATPGSTLSFGKPSGRTLGNRRIVQISFVANDSGKSTYWNTGFILGGEQRISLVVSAPNAALARRNFDLFARHLANW